MQQTFKLSVLASLLAFAVVQARADQTNLVQQFSIQFSGVKQGPTVTNRNLVTTEATPVRVNTRTVIDALGAATGNVFSRNAALVVVSPLPEGSSTVEVRDGNLNVDVTAFFVVSHPSSFVTASSLNLRTGRTSSTDFSIERLQLVDGAGSPLSLHFDVNGIAVYSQTSDPTQTPRSNLDLDVFGSGDNNGEAVILQGTVRISGHTIEVVSGSPPGV